MQMVPAVYRHVEETVDILEAFKMNTDIFLFAGPIPFQIASNYGCDVPMVYIPYTGTALYRVLFQLMKDDASVDNFNRRLRLSVDVLGRDDVQEQMAELDIVLQDLYVKEYQVGQNLEEIGKYHYDLWVNSRVDTIVTCVTSVYESLQRQGIPCYRIIPTRSAIHDSLRMVQLEGKSINMRGTQLVISIISIGSLDDCSSQESAVRNKKQIEKILAGLGETTRNLIYCSDRNEIMLVTTRGVIEELTNKFTRFPLLDEIQSTLRLPVNQGIGIGYTAGEAESKAREALVKAESAGDGGCYAVLQNGTVLGPLGRHVQLNYSIRSDDPGRLKIAKEAGVSVGTINKLWSLNEYLDNSTVTAGELASWFDITMRSARRIMHKLVEKRLAVVVGEEQPINKGRPRRLYTLKLR